MRHRVAEHDFGAGDRASHFAPRWRHDLPLPHRAPPQAHEIVPVSTLTYELDGGRVWLAATSRDTAALPAVRRPGRLSWFRALRPPSHEEPSSWDRARRSPPHRPSVGQAISDKIYAGTHAGDPTGAVGDAPSHRSVRGTWREIGRKGLMLEAHNRQGKFGEDYVRVLASAAGLTVYQDNIDHDGIDLGIRLPNPPQSWSKAIEVQVKTTAGASPDPLRPLPGVIAGDGPVRVLVQRC